MQSKEDPEIFQKFVMSEEERGPWEWGYKKNCGWMGVKIDCYNLEVITGG